MNFRIAFIFIFSLTLIFAYSQSKDQLENDRKNLIKQIEKTNKYLESALKNKSLTLKDIEALKSQVESRKILIANISKDINSADYKVKSNRILIDSLSRYLSLVNNQLVEIQHINYLRHLSNNRWAFLFSSSNLNTFLLRWRYAVQFDNYSKKKNIEIAQIKNTILSSNAEITKIIENKKILLIDEEKEKKTLETEKTKKDLALKTLTSKEKDLNIQLQDQKVKREKLNKAIEQFIAKQLNEIKSIQTNKNSDNQGASSNIKLADDFKLNKSKLAWPISSAYISSKFGLQSQEGHKNITFDNSGIDLSANGNRDVKSIFNGVVVGVAKIPEFKNMVIIKHGMYYSVYSNLDVVFVKKGDNISTLHSIGNIVADESNIAKLHFELWEIDNNNKTKLNPENWLR